MKNKFGIGDEVIVDFKGKISEISISYDGKVKYTVKSFSENSVELCVIYEDCLLLLQDPKAELKANLEYERQKEEGI